MGSERKWLGFPTTLESFIHHVFDQHFSGSLWADLKFWGEKGMAGESEPRTLPGYLVSRMFTQLALKNMQKTSGQITIDYSCYGHERDSNLLFHPKLVF